MNTKLDRLRIADSLLIVVDVQGKLATLMDEAVSLHKQIGVLIDGCRLLEVPIIWAEQLPDKLGRTSPDLAVKLQGVECFAKSSFGCCEDSALATAIIEHRRSQVILCGIEAHVCVWQTAAVLLSQGYQVHAISDAISSRSPENRQVGLSRMREAGAQVSCVEMALFELMGNAAHPKFRDVVKLLK